MNLVVGDGSQLYPYFKKYDPNILGVSARNFDVKNLGAKTFDRVFITFAEQRLFLNEGVNFFAEINELIVSPAHQA